MFWRFAADVVVTTHFLLIVFMVTGGFLARRHRWVTFPHLAAVVYAAVIETAGFTCPLTPLEKSLRTSAGQAGYDGGFVEHYMVRVIYPGGLTTGVRLLLVGGLLIATSIAYREHLKCLRPRGRREGWFDDDRHRAAGWAAQR